METYIAIIKTDSKKYPKERIAIGAYNYCDFIESLNNIASARWHNWEYVKTWKLR